MNIVTASDSVFFHCAMELAKSVRLFYDKPLLLYDLGLLEEQKKQIDAIITPIEVSAKVNHRGKCTLSPNGIPSTRATHKPFCVRHYFQNYSEPMILVDADCLFKAKIEEKGFDAGVTLAKVEKRKKYYNGYINSGVIFFNNSAQELVDRWAIECEKENTTDQKALSDILDETIDWRKMGKIQNWNGLKIKLFNGKIYNDTHLTRRGKILHFIGSRHNKGIYEKLIECHEQGKDIRTIFRWIKRGQKTGLARIFDNIVNFWR